ncbi:MAG TPA: hypothetical protein VFM55_19390 [Micromonosporaceae bacterium]|nr:hypothetical protein [Micromonosporaceae bacterium]
MPATQAQQARRGGRPLTVLFWSGVGLFPLAALLLLFADGDGSLRGGAVLALLSVIMIGLSVALRKDPDSVRVELEDALLDEVDAVRDDVRNDIATAARATHRQFSEKLHHLHESVEALRAEVDAVRLGYEHVNAAPSGARGPATGVVHHASAADHPAGPGRSSGMGRARIPAPVVGGGVVRHTETVQVTTRQTIVDPHAEGQSGRGTVYGGGTVYGARSTETAPAGRHGGSAAEWNEPVEESWTEQRLRERFLAARAEEGRAGSRDRSGEGRQGDARYGDGRDGRDWLDDDHTRRGDGRSRDDDSPDRWDGWLGTRALERGESSRGEGRRSRSYDRDDDDPGMDERWSGMRAGDRWAAVRTDDRGRELRMGERRAALHSDESGTEVRIEDRWASVRRDELRPRRDDEARSRRDDEARSRRDDDLRRPDDEPRWRRDDDLLRPRRDGDRREDRFGQDETDESTRAWDVRADWAAEREESRRAPAALPAASSEPSWSGLQARGDSGREAWGHGGRASEGGRVGRRRRRDDDDDYRYDDDLAEPPRSRSRRVEFEPSDERWR